MHLFYTPDIKGNQYTLDETESKHCVRVLRLNNGDKIQLVDGKGSFFEAVISHAHPKACQVEITDAKHEVGKRNFRLHIAIGPTKSIDRFEWFLEKSTEIGIDEITPLLCRYSERKNIKPVRLENIITSAMKQSLKAYRPVLNEMTSFKDFISQEFDGEKYIAHLEPTERKLFSHIIPKGKNVLILIGPEGDFSPEEIQLAFDNGFQPVSLGESRLRTETAGVVACHTVNLINELK